jgi:hypothetical protein
MFSNIYFVLSYRASVNSISTTLLAVKEYTALTQIYFYISRDFDDYKTL